MGMPNIPNIKPEIRLYKDDVVKLLLSSIALEEIGLAHILNAEGEKIQKSLEGRTNIHDLLEVDKSVQTTLRDIIKKEMLLQFKFEDTLDYYHSGYIREEGEASEESC
ncbi:MAG: hypothetical protein Q8865_03740 [Bacillota bacterium]|nr:hypothetical protein [Bacillota bacterium]